MLWTPKSSAFTILIIFLAEDLRFSEGDDLQFTTTMTMTTTATTGRCPINLVIAVDVSASACPPGSQDVNGAIAQLIKNISDNLQMQDSRISLVLFDENILTSHINSLFNSTEMFLNTVLPISCAGAGTDIRNSMIQIINFFKQHESHAVPGAPKITLVITDGQDNTDVAEARRRANEQQITVYAAGLERCPGTDDELENGTTPSGNIASADTVTAYQSAPRRCACNLHGAWLDIVLVIDSSKAISRQDFVALTHAIVSLVQQMSIGPANGKYSRIAIVKMSETAKRIANFSSFNNSKEAVTAIKNLTSNGFRKNDSNVYDETVNIAAGLLEAQNILRDRRVNVKGMVILFSSSDVPCHMNSYRLRKRSVPEDEDPCRVAERIKNERNVLATVALKFGKVKTYPLINISTPCYAINSDLKFLTSIKKLICNANCFCFDPYVQFKENNSCEPYGECIYLQSIPNDYVAASDTCGVYNSTLVDISSKSKDDFIRKLHEGSRLTPYWIGLRTESGSIVWNTDKQLLPEDYANWAPGNPDQSVGNCTYVDLKGGTTAMWKSGNCTSLEESKFFSCQRISCDTDTYCDF